MRNYHILVRCIIENLCGRGGFDEWWYNIDEDIKKEIRKEMNETIKFFIENDNDSKLIK